MVICIDCGHRIVDDMKFCPQCGCPVEKSYNNSTQTSPFNEKIIMSTEETEFQFYSGVKVVEVDRKIHSDEVTLIYEVYNPTKYLIQISSSDGIMFDENNEIINKASYGYFNSSDINFPINPDSRALIRLSVYPDADDYEFFGKIIQVIKIENVTNKYEIENNIEFTRVALDKDTFGDGIDMLYDFHDISAERCKERTILWRCQWFDRCNNIICQSTSLEHEIDYHDSIHGTQPCLYLNDNPYFYFIIYVHKTI